MIYSSFKNKCLIVFFDINIYIYIYICLPGVIYDVIVEPPNVGSTIDEFGHSRRVSTCPEHFCQT